MREALFLRQSPPFVKWYGSQLCVLQDALWCNHGGLRL